MSEQFGPTQDSQGNEQIQKKDNEYSHESYAQLEMKAEDLEARLEQIKSKIDELSDETPDKAKDMIELLAFQVLNRVDPEGSTQEAKVKANKKKAERNHKFKKLLNLKEKKEKLEALLSEVQKTLNKLKEKAYEEAKELNEQYDKKAEAVIDAVLRELDDTEIKERIKKFNVLKKELEGKSDRFSGIEDKYFER